MLCTTKATRMNLISKITFLISSILIASCGDGKQNSEEAKPDTMTQVSIKNKEVFIDHNIYGTGDYTLLFVHG